MVSSAMMYFATLIRTSVKEKMDSEQYRGS